MPDDFENLISIFILQKYISPKIFLKIRSAQFIREAANKQCKGRILHTGGGGSKK